MVNLLTPDEKKSLRLASRYLNSMGMKVGTLETEGYDRYEDFADAKIKATEWTHFTNNYSIDVPEQLYPIIDKVFSYSQKKYMTLDIDTNDNEINYASVWLDINTKTQDISVRYSYHYYDVGGETSSSFEDDGEIFSDLTTNNIPDDNIMELRYNGSGDSGYLENTFENGESVPASIEDWCYDALNGEYGGWENNEGSQGRFYFNMENKTITLEHQYNTEESSSVTLYEENFSK